LGAAIPGTSTKETVSIIMAATVRRLKQDMTDPPLQIGHYKPQRIGAHMVLNYSTQAEIYFREKCHMSWDNRYRWDPSQVLYPIKDDDTFLGGIYNVDSSLC
jgi:hypothetical protein